MVDVVLLHALEIGTNSMKKWIDIKFILDNMGILSYICINSSKETNVNTKRTEL